VPGVFKVHTSVKGLVNSQLAALTTFWFTHLNSRRAANALWSEVKMKLTIGLLVDTCTAVLPVRYCCPRCLSACLPVVALTVREKSTPEIIAIPTYLQNNDV